MPATGEPLDYLLALKLNSLINFVSAWKWDSDRELSRAIYVLE